MEVRDLCDRHFPPSLWKPPPTCHFKIHEPSLEQRPRHPLERLPHPPVRLDPIVQRPQHLRNRPLLSQRRNCSRETLDLPWADMRNRRTSLNRQDVFGKCLTANEAPEKPRLQCVRPTQTRHSLHEEAGAVVAVGYCVFQTSIDPRAVHCEHDIAGLNPIVVQWASLAAWPPLDSVPPEPSLPNVVSSKKPHSVRRGRVSLAPKRIARGNPHNIAKANLGPLSRFLPYLPHLSHSTHVRPLAMPSLPPGPSREGPPSTPARSRSPSPPAPAPLAPWLGTSHPAASATLPLVTPRPGTRRKKPIL